MIQYDNPFINEAEIKKFVDDAENTYKQQIFEIARHILLSPGIQFLTLAGPTCSGKTTTSYILKNELEKKGIAIKIISIDDFYRDRDDISDDEKPDYESISAIDFDIFVDCVNKIRNGETALLPQFDFQFGHRVGFVPHKPSEHEIVIFEGIQAIYPEITATLPADTSKSIYISVDEDVSAYGVYFDKREVRFLRRLVRDFLFRNASVSRTLELWEGVVKNEDKNIIPYGKNANYIINSFLKYELNVIGAYLINVIAYNPNLPHEMELYQYFQKKFENIPTISSRFIPENSVFREFVGKK